MPFALVTIGLILIVSGVKNTYADLGAQVKSDFTGPGNFTYWLAAVGTVGALGYVDKLRPFANAFLALIIIAMVLANGGFFDKFKSALQSGPSTEPTKPTNASAPANDNKGASLDDAAHFASTALQIFAAVA